MDDPEKREHDAIIVLNGFASTVRMTYTSPALRCWLNISICYDSKVQTGLTEKNEKILELKPIDPFRSALDASMPIDFISPELTIGHYFRVTT